MKNKLAKLIALICVIVTLFTLAGCSNKKDVGRDPNGFLGYSDSFWEWQMKQ